MTCKFRSTASISFALPCTTVNAGEGVTAVYTQLAGNPMMALSAVWVSHSRPRKVPEGGFRKRLLATGEQLLEGSWKRYSVPFPKVLRTFSWPVLNDDVINCPLGYVASVRATRKLSLHKTSQKSKHESLERGSTTQLGVFRVNQRLI